MEARASPDTQAAYPPVPSHTSLLRAAPITLLRVQVLMVDSEKGAIVVKGSLPGKPGNLLEIVTAKQLGKNV